MVHLARRAPTIEKGRNDTHVGLVLPERAPSEGWGGERPGALLARRTRTMKLCSFDARSKGQPWPLS